MDLLTLGERKLLQGRFAAAVLRRLSELNMPFENLSQQTGLSLGKLSGQSSMTNGELNVVVNILWPGKKPYEVVELWPRDPSANIQLFRRLMVEADLGNAPVGS